MSLTRYQRAAYGLLGGLVERRALGDAALQRNLERAHVRLRPEVHLASHALTAFLGALLVAFLVAGALLLAHRGALPWPPRALLPLAPLPLLAGALLYARARVGPWLGARARGRAIDAQLPYALHYASAMAGAGVAPERIVEGLARQRVYGALADEMARIHRDLHLLGQDLGEAFAAAAARTPSKGLRDVLQGALATATSGGDLRAYFVAKSEQCTWEHRQRQERFLEGLGVLAESFVTVVVAAPLFLLVMMSVMTMFGADPRGGLQGGYLLVLGLLPAAQLGFAAAIAGATPEA